MILTKICKTLLKKYCSNIFDCSSIFGPFLLAFGSQWKSESFIYECGLVQFCWIFESFSKRNKFQKRPWCANKFFWCKDKIFWFNFWTLMNFHKCQKNFNLQLFGKVQYAQINFWYEILGQSCNFRPLWNHSLNELWMYYYHHEHFLHFCT